MIKPNKIFSTSYVSTTDCSDDVLSLAPDQQRITLWIGVSNLGGMIDLTLAMENSHWQKLANLLASRGIVPQPAEVGT